MPIQTAPVLRPFLSSVPETAGVAARAIERTRWPVSILGVPLDPVTSDEALARIAEMVASGRPHYVVTPNVDFLVQARHDEELRQILCEADLALCDGQPLVWASRWLGNPLPERVAGADLAPRLLEQAARLGHRVFLLGATPESNEEARLRLQQRLPDLQLAGQYAPPFRPLAEMDNDEIICRVRAAEPDIVLVSFGCPKQEKWIARHYRALDVPVCLGVGATIDFLAGRVSRAPVWMRRSGLEWTYRLGLEPRRLFRRYATDARYFGTAVLGQWLSAPRRAFTNGTLEMISATPPCHHLRATGALCRPVLDGAAEISRRIMEADCDCQLDLAAVNFIDSTGVGAFTAWHRQLRRTGHRLVLGRPSDTVRRMLRQMRQTHFATTDSAPQGAAA
ncbi:MAG: Anti-anti-sigma factor/polymer biosynthesis protein WecB/TagA/CpsF family [Lacunisphaera sp.]|nr:Anti-anti-sigma factor/polymer biosynthesis protein WecB/TagA/CpsF family [Lacunisphaera sp.]